MPSHQGVGRRGRGECREEAVGELLADRMKVKHWPTVLSHSWSRLLASGQGLTVLTRAGPARLPKTQLPNMDFP